MMVIAIKKIKKYAQIFNAARVEFSPVFYIRGIRMQHIQSLNQEL